MIPLSTPYEQFIAVAREIASDKARTSFKQGQCRVTCKGILPASTENEARQAPSFETAGAWIEGTTRSGRRFRYEIGEYYRLLQADSPPDRVVLLAQQATKEKFRSSPWDRAHAHVNSEEEVCERLIDSFRQRVDALKRAQE